MKIDWSEDWFEDELECVHDWNYLFGAGEFIDTPHHMWLHKSHYKCGICGDKKIKVTTAGRIKF